MKYNKKLKDQYQHHPEVSKIMRYVSFILDKFYFIGVSMTLVTSHFFFFFFRMYFHRGIMFLFFNSENIVF